MSKKWKRIKKQDVHSARRAFVSLEFEEKATTLYHSFL